MTIKRNDSFVRKIEFGSVGLGVGFICYNEIFMKVDFCSSKEWTKNAVNMSDGSLHYFPEDALVDIRNMTLNVDP